MNSEILYESGHHLCPYRRKIIKQKVYPPSKRPLLNLNERVQQFSTSIGGKLQLSNAIDEP